MTCPRSQIKTRVWIPSFNLIPGDLTHHHPPSLPPPQTPETHFQAHPDPGTQAGATEPTECSLRATDIVPEGTLYFIAFILENKCEFMATPHTNPKSRHLLLFALYRRGSELRG